MLRRVLFSRPLTSRPLVTRPLVTRPLATVLAVSAVSLALVPVPGLLISSDAPLAEAAARHATSLRVASFNVRTARALQDRRSWLTRAPDVAREIMSRRPGVVALQELGPGRADGRKGTLHGATRQTDSLLSALAQVRGTRYRLVRTTPYVSPRTRNGTQGARILYDSSRYDLLSDCPDFTGTHAYSSSCSIKLPLNGGDGNGQRREAAYAKFRDQQTGRQFYLVSAHLDARHSGSPRKEAGYNHLRARQAAHIASVIARLNTSRLPVIFGADVNSWRHDRSNDAPHRALGARGFWDSAARARTRINIRYSTVNHFQAVMRKSGRSTGVALDVLMVRGGREAKRFENKMSPVDHSRPSDHNMVVSDLVL